MKNLMLGIFFLGFVISGYSQKVIRLDEMTLRTNAEMLRLGSEGNSILINIPETYKGEFYENPLGFAKAKFDMKEFILINQDRNFDSYDVTYKTNKGDLYVKYNKIGEMISAYQSFKDVALPHHLMMKTVKANKGYSLVGTKHVGKSKGNWAYDKEFYKIKLKNGNKSKNVKINVERSLTGEIASN